MAVRKKTPTLDDLTVADLKQLVHGGGPENVSVSERLAQLEAARAAQLEHNQAHAERQRTIRRWQEDHVAAGREAYQAAYDANLANGNPQADEAGREARLEALERFERDNPPPVEIPDGALASRVIRRTVEAVREAVA